MTREDLVYQAIKKKASKYFPVTFGFSNLNTERYLAEKLSMSHEEFIKYCDSDIKDIYLMDDFNMYTSDNNLLNYALSNGFAFDGGLDGILFDRWGIGWSTKSVGLEVRISPIKIAEDIENYNFPKVNKENNFYSVEKDLRKLKEVGYGILIPQYIALFERAWALMGYENFFIECYQNRKHVEKLLDIITEYKIDTANQIIRHDVTCGHTGDDYGLQNGGVMSLELWRELFKPRLKRIWNVYKKKNIPVVHHTCGDCRLYIDDMIEIGLDVLHPVQPTTMPIKELYDKYGSVLTFYGGVDCINTLTYGTPEDVKKNVEETISILGKNGGLILSAINIMPNVPADNLISLIENINRYRMY